MSSAKIKRILGFSPLAKDRLRRTQIERKGARAFMD
tara:strand:- start:494 stop:601 length:108 start_codon:yes stop_codon:yes gene_type:complete